MKRLLIIIFLTICFNSFAQENKTNFEELLSLYTTALDLNSNDSKKLSIILTSYHEKLNKKDIEASVFNANLKAQTLEVYDLLSKNKYTLYLKLIAEHQPELTFRFK
ncbi:hypothetical protein [Lacinutrix sp. Hel_I_90]|uniref:hypothetical protein n=1 Tax=Lacinutrix sp. Hel_I_90 TaxID=1249999 RepID=UPI0005CA3436|nr:hypothetical protein [Lacinutrix sp. Hel_I_90]